jgi:hypothetical protein
MAVFNNITTFSLHGQHYQLTVGGNLRGGYFELLDQHKLPVVSGNFTARPGELALLEQVKWWVDEGALDADGLLKEVISSCP